MPDPTFYKDREQTYVKHLVLDRYLFRLAAIVGRWRENITYIDGFSGPWKERDENLADTSPSVAIGALKRAADVLVAGGVRRPRLRCMFIETDAAAHARLKAWLPGQGLDDHEAWNLTFEDAVPAAVRFAGAAPHNFTFTFIDPTGWTGFGLSHIAPLLRVSPGEVLVNFMTSHISRFIDSPDPSLTTSFEDLFGSLPLREKWAKLSGQDREDAIVRTYCERLAAEFGSQMVASAVVLNPNDNRSHFHLIYATRDIRGLEVFREVEREAFGVQEQTRDEARLRRTTAASGQAVLFGAHALGSPYASDLRERYHRASRARCADMLSSRLPLTFDELEVAALAFPFTSGQDLQAWIMDWRARGTVRVDGLKPRERTLKRGSAHRVTWIGT